MKILKNILIALAILVILFLIYAAITPKTIVVKKNAVVNAPVSEVYEFVRSVKNVSDNTVWQKKDPNVKKYYRGTDGEVGSVYRWESDVKEVGVGEQEIINLVPDKSVTTALRFEKPFEMNDKAVMYTDAADGGTKLRWEYESGKIPFPMNAFVVGSVTKQLEKDFDQSLANIKRAIEAN